MSILLMGNPSVEEIATLIKNNSKIFAASLSIIIRNNFNNYISEEIANLITNNKEEFTQAITTLIDTNIDNYFSQSITNVIENYHNHFEGALSPALNGFGPVSFTDFTDRTYWVPIGNVKWNITWPGGGNVRLSTNVGAQDDLYQRTFCGLRFRAGIFPDETTKRAIVRVKITNINNGNPSTTSSNHRHLIGLALSTAAKAWIVGVGRNGTTSANVTASYGYNTSVATTGELIAGTGPSTEFTGSVWEVKMSYEWDFTNDGMRMQSSARVDEGSWVNIHNKESYFGITQLCGLRFAVMGCALNSIYPEFGGTVTEFSIDEGRYISL